MDKNSKDAEEEMKDQIREGYYKESCDDKRTHSKQTDDILPHIFNLYASRATPQDFDIYAPDATFEDPLMCAHGVKQIKSAFYSMPKVFSESRIVDYTIQENIVSPGKTEILIDNKQYYKFLGRDIDMISLIRLYVEDGKVVRHEDWWDKKPLWNRETVKTPLFGRITESVRRASMFATHALMRVTHHGWSMLWLQRLLDQTKKQNPYCTVLYRSIHRHTYSLYYLHCFFIQEIKNMVILLSWFLGGLFLFFSPLLTPVNRIIQRMFTESGIPAFVLLSIFNCLLYTWYRLPFVSPNNAFVLPKNEFAMAYIAMGVCEALILPVILVITVPKHEQGKVLGQLLILHTFLAVVAVLSIFDLHGNNWKVFSGIVASVFSIILYGSLLTVIMMVVKTKSVEFMPFSQSLATFLVGTCWFNLGRLESNLFFAIPNGFAAVLGAVQLLLHAIYNRHPIVPRALRQLLDGWEW